MKKKNLLESKSVEELTAERARLKAWRGLLWGFIAFVLLVFVDQFTKLAADVYFGQKGNAPVAVIPGWVYLEITYNPGVAYGMLGNAAQWVKIAIVVGTAVLMAVLGVFYVRIDARRSFLRVAFLLIIAGGVGNLIDRVQYKVWELGPGATIGVRDMINLERFGFAVCNLADFFITFGAVMLVLGFLFFDRDALFPTGKKYKALAQEVEDKKNALVEVKGTRSAEDYEPRTDDTTGE
ncbi:MAG: signal peptidase II [Clostridiales bacterium]|nr:signal peptidase II [Clostridiales bacterium]